MAEAAKKCFNPRSPRGGATSGERCDCESDREFQSTLPTRGSDSGRPCRPDPRVVSIHAPHEGERRDCRQPSPRQLGVSIHAPHEGERHAGDRVRILEDNGFNPRSPRGGATIAGGLADLTREVFQSTLPTRGSDKAKYRPGASRTCFNPRSPRGGATRQKLPRRCRGLFQSTLPTRGSDRNLYRTQAKKHCFNPRSPRGGATHLP